MIHGVKRPSRPTVLLLPERRASLTLVRSITDPARLSESTLVWSTKERLRRPLNCLVAGAGLVLAAPLMVVIAAAIRLTSRGPALYVQERVGLDRRRGRSASIGHRRRDDVGGRPFTIYKFRTMRVDAESASGAVWAAQDDPRVTAVGKVLRRTRLDELPQLINVLKGDMNIVGARPERPQIFAELRQQIDGYALRQRARPGITGLAQVNLAYDSNLDSVRHKVRYDLAYLKRQSLLEDLRIMLRTVPVMVFRRGGW